MIKIGIYGYGNLGKGVEKAIKVNDDLELVAVFTRRNPSDLKIDKKTAKVVSSNDILSYKDKIDPASTCFPTPSPVQYHRPPTA